MYYGSWLGFGSIGRFNVCTNVQESTFTRDEFVDELRVLPNWEVLRTTDTGATLYGVSGQVVRRYEPHDGADNGLRTMSLDPDGTSFWVCCTLEKGDLLRFDINSGELLTRWKPIGRGPIAVYSPDNNGRGAG
jgi:hypothetical protein